MAGDLHTKKATHISFPLNAKGAEFHLRNSDVKSTKKPKIGKSYNVVFKAKATSADGTAQRYRPTSLPDVVDHKTKRETVKKPYSH